MTDMDYFMHAYGTAEAARLELADVVSQQNEELATLRRLVNEAGLLISMADFADTDDRLRQAWQQKASAWLEKEEAITYS